MSNQNDMDRILNKMDAGLIGPDEANVLLVQVEGVRIVRNRMPRQVRRALNDAVKKGALGHMKKDGHKPEAYYHINARADAVAERDRIERNVKNAIPKIAAGDRK